ncbi:hypothetical protein L208DRAFT_1336744 [Tricholoma matsutake]|nr:hypothetical protein L208DRAFT_1336744 [Tricholoma matsutake 945]
MTLAVKSGSSTTATPLQRLALHSTSTCSDQASSYGKCILATYTDVKKNSCREEFVKFGECLRKAVSSCLKLVPSAYTVIYRWDESGDQCTNRKAIQTSTR